MQLAFVIGTAWKRNWNTSYCLYLCITHVKIQGLSLDANNDRQRPHYIQQQLRSEQITWKCNAAINKSHHIASHCMRLDWMGSHSVVSRCNCKIIHCKVSKKCNWNANQCKSILESSSATTTATRTMSEWMNDSCLAREPHSNANVKCQMRNANCKNLQPMRFWVGLPGVRGGSIGRGRI